MKKYESYKESNNTAIGLIPYKWSVTSIKNILEIPITDGPHTTPKFYDDGIPFLSADAVKKGKLDFKRKRGFISKEDFELFSQKYVPKKGDIFMVKSGATTGNTAMVETDDVFNIWSPLAVFRANSKKVYPKFLHYYLMSPNFKSLVEISWSYGTQQNIGMGVLSNLPISYSSIDEQTQIAKYLDYKTQIIDALIDKKEQLIKKLQAQRQAIINEAVTKGLNKNVPLKDSGIEWLGKIPEYWEVVKLNYLVNKIGDGLHSTPKYTDEENYFFINGNNLNNGLIEIFEKTRTVDKVEFKKLWKEIDNTTLLLSINGTIGNVALYNDEPVILGKSACFINCGTRIDREFLMRLFQSSFYKNYFMNEVTGTTIFNLSLETIRNCKIVIPSISDQKEISSYLNIQLNKSDKLLKSCKKTINKLKSYRQSIISEAVTGKIDVRDWQPPKK